MTDVTVRIGEPDDLDQVMALAGMMHQEIGISALSPDKVLPEIWAALNRDHGLMGVIGPRGGRIEGGILLTVGKFFYSDEDALEEKGLFVHPDFRTAAKTRKADGANAQPHAALLCEFAKRAADKLAMPLLIGVQDPTRATGKIRLYERKFGPPIGAQFLYRPAVSEVA